MSCSVPLFWADYQLYLAHASEKRFQPHGWTTYQSLRRAGFNPLTSTWEKRHA